MTRLNNHSQNEIWQIIQDINNCWLSNNIEELKKYFHKNMVIAGPEMHELADNSEKCIKSYADFINNAVTHDYKGSDPIVNIFGITAIASYRFDIIYEMNGKTYNESGRDLFVFNKEYGKWLAVWRTIIPIYKE